MTFEDRLKQDILHNGPVDVGTFMGRVATHYYGTRDPFGTGGDFTTAPEISQMFGELLGAWAADVWTQMGRPNPFVLAECGPGRGTLMADALRATAKVPGFHAAADIRLIEMSPVLKEKQQATLRDHKVFWHERLEDVPEGRPMILLANEFFDALPVRQFQKQGGRWHERVIGLDERGALQFGLVPADGFAPDADGDFCEVSQAGRDIVRALCRRLIRTGGAALVIDYGYVKGSGETLQAVKAHRPVPVLETPGEADLTAHVDFAALAVVAAREGATVRGPAAQGAFLHRLGIGQRAAALRQNAAAEIDEALKRLADPAEMGELFKVMAFCGPGVDPAGF